MLHYTDTGSGTALVFLHYFGGSALTWQPVIEQLKNDYRCIAIDMKGFGQSEAPKTTISVLDQQNAVLEVLNSLHLEKYTLIGHSMGGKIALAVATTKPEGLAGLLLLAPSPPTPEPLTRKDRKDLNDAWGNEEKITEHINNIVAAPLPVMYMEQTVSDNVNCSNIAWQSWLYVGSMDNISGKMNLINVSVHVMSGAEDKGLTTDFLKEEFSKYFPQLSFAEIKNSGHLLPLEQPDKVVEKIYEMAG